MPELPEVEALADHLRRHAVGATIGRVDVGALSVLKTFDPPLSALEGRRLRGAERRGKRLLFPTDDGELVLLIHLMTSGRLKTLSAGETGPKLPGFAAPASVVTSMTCCTARSV